MTATSSGRNPKSRIAFLTNSWRRLVAIAAVIRSVRAEVDCLEAKNENLIVQQCHADNILIMHFRHVTVADLIGWVNDSDIYS
jgi:hypothetical protein